MVTTHRPRHWGNPGPRRHLFRGLLLAAAFCAGCLSSGPPAARAQTAGDSLYAVLWCGNSDYTPYVNDMKFAFTTLVNDYGYDKENILVLLKGGWYYGGTDLDGDGLGDIDFAATAANIDTAFARLSRVVTQGDIVFFYCTDHGYYENSDCNDAGLRGYDWNDDLVSEEDLAEYLGRLDTPERRVTKIVVFNTCDAGGMIPELDDLPAPLMIASAAKACEAAHYDDDDCDYAQTSCWYSAYSFWWFTAMHGTSPDDSVTSTADTDNDGYVTIKEASSYAKANDEYALRQSSPKESPLFWDKNCVSGSITTLGGLLPDLPGMIAFPHPCHGPVPCRWSAWNCGPGVVFPLAGGSADTGAPAEVQATLWMTPRAAPGDSCHAYARVYNGGDAPITSSVVNFYYADPTLSVVFPQSGLTGIGTEYVPYLAPHDTLVVGPVSFLPPPANSFGEPHWTLVAVAENYDSPVETGWLVDDDHVGAENSFELRALGGEPRSFHISAQNPLGAPVKAILSLDDSQLPTGWTALLTPAAGDTVEIGPDSSVPVELVLTGVYGAVDEGVVHITLSLNTANAKVCESCEDSLCGGYIGDAGGCSVKLVLEGSVPVFAPKVMASAGDRAITLTWDVPAGADEYGFNVYRSEKGSAGRIRLNPMPLFGSGRMMYVDRDVSPGRAYVYVVGALAPDGEVLSAPAEASLAEPIVLELHQSYPNPFNPTTTIAFSLPRAGRVTLAIYDVDGRRVRTIFEGVLEAGFKEYSWDGTDSRGGRMSSGVYFCRLETADRVLTEKITYLK